MINPTKVVPKRKGLVIIKKKRPEEQEVKIVKEDFEVKKTQKSLSDIFSENEEKNFEKNNRVREDNQRNQKVKKEKKKNSYKSSRSWKKNRSFTY